MPLTKLQFRPGIVREATNYSNEGGWFDCDKIRFRDGFPETIGGWARYTSDPFLGVCRSLNSWAALDGDLLTSVGTNLKFYIAEGGTLNDITPVRRTVTLGTDPITTGDAGSGIVTITDTSHGAYLNDFVTISGATAVDGLTTDDLNKEHQIVEIVDADSYKIDTGGSATSGSTSGGGASVVAAYQINTGLDTSVFGTGWGADPWGSGGWGEAATTTVPGAQLRVWSQDNFGEDLLLCPRDGGIYYWDKSSGFSSRAVDITTLSGSLYAPTVAKIVLVSERDNHVIALGCDGQFSTGVMDPLLIRFSDQSLPLTDWNVASDENTAGELRLNSGSEIVAAVQTKQQIFILTDSSAYTMQYIGPPFTFGVSEVSTNTTVIGPNAAVAIGDAVFWMGRGQFYTYNGVVTQLPCSVKEYIFDDLNEAQALKVVAGSNTAFGEVWWFYPSSGSVNVDKYVIYNYQQNIWYYGSLARSAWDDRSVLQYPIAAALDGYVYYHDFGLNDGESNPATSIPSYIESSSFDVGDGDQFMFASRIIPDINFRNSTNSSPTVTLTMKARNFPGATFINTDDGDVIRTATIPVQQYTNQSFIRLRGRSMAIRVESDQTNTAWRLGTPRLDIRTDGRR